MNLTEKELAALRQSATRIERLTAFLDQNAPPSPEMGSQEWFTYLEGQVDPRKLQQQPEPRIVPDGRII